MLSVHANERFTRVGPGTPCGTLMRRYWIPIRPYAQLLSEPVMKVRVLGEDLVLFRTRRGEMGLIGDRCAHRLTGLEYGIPEEDGLRCPYHGWMYGPSGQCLETPLEAPGSTLKDRIKIKAFPVQEMGGLVWAYLGEAPAPLLPPWPIFVWPNAVRQIGYAVLPCNWLQCHENTGDPAHSVYLHGHLFKYALEKEGLLEDRAQDRQTHRAFTSMRMGTGIESLYAHQTPYGLEKGTRYSKALGAREDVVRRHTTVIFPFFTGGDITSRIFHQAQIRVPIDDTHTYHIQYEMFAAPPGVEAPGQDLVPFYEHPTRDRDGRPILDYVLAQDMIAWISQGDITDRSREQLARTDVPIAVLRQQLEQAIQVVEDGGDPINVFHDQERMRNVVGMTNLRDEEQAKRLGGTDGFTAYREQYHKGYWRDDVGRYGPANDLVYELERRAEHAYGSPR